MTTHVMCLYRRVKCVLFIFSLETAGTKICPVSIDRGGQMDFFLKKIIFTNQRERSYCDNTVRTPTST